MRHAITSVEGFWLSCDLPERVGNARTTFSRRSALLVRVTTSSGHHGWGESWAYPDATSEIIRRRLGPALLGADPTRPMAALAPLAEFGAQDRRGLHHMATSALDIAVWDAYGSITGRPIHDLLGGARRLSLPAYASGPLLRSGEDPYVGVEEALRSYAAAGFKAFKLRIGIDRKLDAEVIRLAREVVGPDALLMADMNESSTVKDTIAFHQSVEDAGLAWLEEPVQHDNLPAYTRLAAALPVALAGGESFYGLAAFRDILIQGGLDIVQPDLALCGGFGEAMKIAALAEAFGVPIVPHVWGTGINYLASMQFSACIPPTRIGRFHYPLHEIDVGYNPLRECMVDIGVDASGCVTVPQGPGLGVEVRREMFDPFVVDYWIINSQ